MTYEFSKMRHRIARQAKEHSVWQMQRHGRRLKFYRFSAGLLAGLFIGIISALNWQVGAVFVAVIIGALVLQETCRLFHRWRLSRCADLSSPLLRRLALEAPGTYHHCLMVASLAENGANAINANGLLARAAAYYHDIGKLSRPAFYMENQNGHNPHDELSPALSRLIIFNHVKEGLLLAQTHRLPREIIGVIASHHGTSLVRWFHVKAVKQAQEANLSPVNEEDYRYSGPLPRTREETIISLADRVEAASRSWSGFTRDQVKLKLADILAGMWLDGQLDESVLSNAELHAVKESFASTLPHLLHTRKAYPAG